MTSVLFLGLMIGMQHALEADHIAAVASIAARETTLKRAVTHGAAWGLGHTLTLMAVAGGVVVLGTTIDAQIAAYLEAVVGVMLIGLGGHLLYRLWRDRIHFHVHRHTGGAAHFHAHSHKGEAQAHKKSSHDHTHPRRLPVRTVLVGMMHGLAGSAALLILTASTVDSPALGLIYIALFGIGSIAGMAALS
ncbi:MAG: urease accessory protein, partial [Rhodospirillaceae bacterium]|nr:urease accessory protein [Rhodospirillaceae bacterium]